MKEGRRTSNKTPKSTKYLLFKKNTVLGTGVVVVIPAPGS
jgi:hypothetical protein